MARRLSGKYFPTIDTRGRMSFPAQYRAVLGDILYLVPDTDELGYLTVYSQEGYDKFCEELAEKYGGRDKREVMRICCSDATAVEPDKLGRITIPEELCTHAQLGQKAIVLGIGDYSEIWDAERFAAHQKETKEAFLKMMAEDEETVKA